MAKTKGKDKPNKVVEHAKPINQTDKKVLKDWLKLQRKADKASDINAKVDDKGLRGVYEIHMMTEQMMLEAGIRE